MIDLLADPQLSEKQGPCAICGAPATFVRRTVAAASGLLVAARACDEHEDAVADELENVTVEAYAATIRGSAARARRADDARREAGRLLATAREHRRECANLVGSVGDSYVEILSRLSAMLESAPGEALALMIRAGQAEHRALGLQRLAERLEAGE